MSTPFRTCVGCRQSAPKTVLIRVVADGKGGLIVDLKQTAPGRGAYLHATCVTRAQRKGILNRALRTQVVLG